MAGRIKAKCSTRRSSLGLEIVGEESAGARDGCGVGDQGLLVYHDPPARFGAKRRAFAPGRARLGAVDPELGEMTTVPTPLTITGPARIVCTVPSPTIESVRGTITLPVNIPVPRSMRVQVGARDRGMDARIRGRWHDTGDGPGDAGPGSDLDRERENADR